MPSVVDAMNRYRMALATLDQGQTATLLNAWVGNMRGLVAEMDALAAEMAERAARGKPVKLWHLQRMQRYQSLMRQIGNVVDEYAPIAQANIAEAQQDMVRMGLVHSQTLIDMQTASVYTQFDRLPISAFEAMVGNTGAGSPLSSLFVGMPKETGGAVTRALLNGTGLGWHPTKTAREMRNAAGLAFQRSIVIARTEQLRVYREVIRQQYMKSKIVEGYRRVAAKDSRTCIACLVQDGQFFTLDVPFEEHPQGRCAAIPVVLEAEPISYETGMEWFQRQAPDVQQQILGKGRYAVWRAGQAGLADMATLREDEVWGNSYVPTPLKALVH